MPLPEAQPEQLDVNAVLHRVDRMLAENGADRASLLRRLRELNPPIYQQWLSKAAQGL